MKILPFAQQSVEWMIARSGKPTASEFHNLISPTWKIRTGEMPQTYLAAKLAEAWLGGPLIGFNSWDADQGKILEEEARPWLELELNTEVSSVGLLITDDGKVGCSPDGMIGDCGVEIKCPQATSHVKYLLAGMVPSEYLPQIHGGMYVSGFKKWLFLSYRRGFPKLLLTVERDEKIQAAIHEALAGFLEQFEIGMARLERLNGGPPKRRTHAPIQSALAAEEPVDIVP